MKRTLCAPVVAAPAVPARSAATAIAADFIVKSRLSLEPIDRVELSGGLLVCNGPLGGKKERS
jgi:hypothetical protein